MRRWRISPRASSARRFVAVDFDSRGVRLVQAERAGAGVRIVRVLARPAPEGLDLADARAVGALVRAALHENRLAGWPLVMCVPRGLAVLKTLDFPPGTAEAELAGMVQYQVEKELPFRPEEAVVDFTAESHFHAGDAPEGDGGTRVLVAAVRVPVVDYYRQIAQAAGARLLRLGLRPYANHRCFAACVAGGRLADGPAGAGASHAVAAATALVHLTADETEIDVFAGRVLAFSRSALGKVPVPEKASEADLAEAAAGVVAEVVRSLQSYQSVEGGGAVDQVYLAGGTGLEERVARLLADRLGVRCQMLQPAEAMRLGGRGAGGGSEFVSALGLAVGGASAPLDFLAPKRPTVPRNVRRMAALAGAAALVLYLTGLAVLYAHIVPPKQSYADSLTATRRAQDTQKKGNDANAARLAGIDGWQRSGQEWLDHLALLSAKLLSPKEAYIGGITGNPDGTLRFTVYAAAEEDITRITQQLNEAGYIATRGGQSKTTDLKYPHKAEIAVRPGAGMEVDLASLTAEPRPEDDLAAGEALPRTRTVQPAGGGGGAAPGGGGGGFRGAGTPGGGNQPGAGNQPAGGQGRAGGAFQPGGGTGGDRGAGGYQPSGVRDPNRSRRFGGTGGYTGRGGAGR